ncbi:MAG: glycoside hydrolase family 73 protein [Peptostreptococcaceae bacterium]
MGRKKIKHLKGKRGKYNLKKVFYIILSFIIIITLSMGIKYTKEMYIAKDIGDSRIEFYMDLADEVGKGNVQLNWKELLAIDMVIYDDELKNVKKVDSLKRAKKFINREKQLKSLDVVLEDLNFAEKEKLKVDKNLKKLEYVFLGDKKLNNKSYEVVFIDKIKNQAIENYEKYGVLPSITIAQCILESGWGKSQLAIEGNNLFGIKANSSWDGKSIQMETSENYNDKIIASFRSYESIEQSIDDHGEFLKQNPRYEDNGLFLAKHYMTQAQALEDAGYSTKKNEYGEKIYADMLINLIRKYNLQLIDCEIYNR